MRLNPDPAPPSGPCWPPTSGTSQTRHLLLKRGPSLSGRERASQLSWPGWLRVGEASCNTGAVPSHFHFIYPPPTHPSFYLLSPSASGPALSPCRGSTVPSQLWQSKWHLFVSSFSPSVTRSLSAVICLFSAHICCIYILISKSELRSESLSFMCFYGRIATFVIFAALLSICFF